MKKSYRILLIFVIISLFAILSSFIDYNDLSSYDIVSGISFDYDGENWTVVCEICLPSSNNDFGSSAEYVKAKGLTPKSALKKAGLKSPNLLYTDSVQLYLFNNNAFSNDELKEFFMSEGCNIRAVAICVDGNAADLLFDEKESNQRAKSLSLADKIKNMSKYWSIPMPTVSNYLKNKNQIFINKQNELERGRIT